MTGIDVFVVAAKRTPIGSLNGALASLPAHELGATAIKAALREAGIAPAEVEEVILGQVLTAGVGMNPARQASRSAGLVDATPAATVNQVCGSGLRAVALASRQIMAGDAAIIVAGGQESMSLAPHVVHLRQGRKLGDATFTDTIMRDGLSDAFYGYSMGVTAENVAQRYRLTRDDQDQFALHSQQKAAEAARTGRFADEIASVTVRDRGGERVVLVDEHIRQDATLGSMGGLRPVFQADGTVTAGNSSGINDGAAALVLMSGQAIKRSGAIPLARIAAFAHTGVDPQVMGLGPISASRKALDRAGWRVEDVELWEVNEAFAAQSLAVMRDLGVDPIHVNVNGGAIAIGHPIGASGARILTTLLHEMKRRDARRGLATLCIGGGMGIAVCIERA